MFLVIMFVATTWPAVTAGDMEFPPCEQINTILCSTQRLKEHCPRMCGVGSPTGNTENDNTKSKGIQEIHDKPKTVHMTTSTATVPRDQEKSSESEEEDNLTTTTTSTSSKLTTKKTTRGKGQAEKSNTLKKSSNTNANSHSNSNSNSRPISNSNKPKCNKIDPCVDAGTANAGFLERCKSRGIKQTCWEKCRYDVDFNELKKAMLGGKCPVAGMREYLKCGANDHDNRFCCEKTGVLDGSRMFCHPFCNPDGREWPGQKEAMKYLPCASQMAQIMRCHWAGIEP